MKKMKKLKSFAKIKVGDKVLCIYKSSYFSKFKATMVVKSRGPNWVKLYSKAHGDFTVNMDGAVTNQGMFWSWPEWYKK